jgi:prepilin-type processing-associated H-X9-DG protein
MGQLIKATLNYESTNGGFPPSAFRGLPVQPGSDGAEVFPVQCCLLPFLEQGSLYNAMNLTLPALSHNNIERFHMTTAVHVVNEFLRPSDPRTRSGRLAPNSYRACTGLGERRPGPGNLLWFQEEGAFVAVTTLTDGTYVPSTLPLSEFRDGMSNTLAFSEKPIGSGSPGPYVPFRDWFRSRTEVQTADQWTELCASDLDGEPAFDAGDTWLIPGAIHTHFYASAPPNSRVPDCGNATINGGVGLFSSRSYHPGGVNAAMADGSVRWFSSGAATATWRSLGTRAGGEQVVD